MGEKATMTSTHIYNPHQKPKQTSSTMSFGAHRQMDLPTSAIHAGANSMPRAWQTRGVPGQASCPQYGAPADNIVDIITAPFRRALATKPRKIACAGLVFTTVVIYLF